MPSEGIRAQGTLLKMGDGGGTEVFTTIAEVKNISGPSMSRDTFDLTTHSSTGSWREFGTGLKDAGEVSFDINYVPTNATHRLSTGVLGDFNSGVRRNYQLVFPNAGATTWSFSGFVTSFETSAPVDDLLGASITIKLTGAPTLV